MGLSFHSKFSKIYIYIYIYIYAYLYPKTQETLESHKYKMPYIYTRFYKELLNNLFSLTKIALLFDSTS